MKYIWLENTYFAGDIYGLIGVGIFSILMIWVIIAGAAKMNENVK